MNLELQLFDSPPLPPPTAPPTPLAMKKQKPMDTTSMGRKLGFNLDRSLSIGKNEERRKEVPS